MILPDCSTVIRGAPRVVTSCSQVLPSEPNILSGAPMYSQTCHNHSHGTPVQVIGDLSYSGGRPECPPRVWYSPDNDPSKFALHILSDPPEGFQWLKCILLMWDLQSSPEWGSWICIKPTLTSCISLWMYHSSPGTPQDRQISHQCACTPVHSALYIVVCFILIIFSSTLNQWTQCTQIYQDTSPLGAGGSSRFASADIWIYAWSVCEGRH